MDRGCGVGVMYLARLEAAVLKSVGMIRAEWGEYGDCPGCPGDLDLHADDCIVTALLEKYIVTALLEKYPESAD